MLRRSIAFAIAVVLALACAVDRVAAQQRDDFSIAEPLSIDAVALALRRHEPIDDATWEAIAAAYREYLDRIDSTVFGPRYAELAPMPFEDDTGDPQAMPTLERELHRMRRAQHRSDVALLISQEFADAVVQALSNSGHADAERFRVVCALASWSRQRFSVSPSRSTLRLLSALRALRPGPADAATVRALTDRIEDASLALRRSRADAEARLQLEWERQRRTIPRPAAMGVDGATEDEPLDRFWRAYTRMEAGFRHESLRFEFDDATKAEAEVRAALPSLTLGGRRSVAAALLRWRLPEARAPVPLLRGIYAALAKAPPGAVPELRQALTEWRRRDDQFVDRLLDRAHDRALLDEELDRLQGADDEEWSAALARRETEIGRCAALIAERLEAGSAAREVVLSIWARASNVDRESLADVEGADHPMLPSVGTTTAKPPSRGGWTAESWSAWNEVWSDLWAGLDGVRGDPESAPPTPEAWEQSDDSFFAWSQPAPLDGDAERFCDRVGMNDDQRAIVASLLASLRERRTERLEAKAESCEARFGSLADATEDQRTLEPELLRDIETTTRELRAFESEFFDSLRAVVDEVHHQAVEAWRLRQELGIAGWVANYRTDRTTTRLPFGIARRHANVAAAVEEGATNPADRERAERHVLAFADELRRANAAMEATELRTVLRCQALEGEDERTVQEIDDESALAAYEQRAEAERTKLGTSLEATAAAKIALERRILADLRDALPRDACDAIELAYCMQCEPEVCHTTARYDALLDAYRRRLTASPDSTEESLARFDRATDAFRRRDRAMVAAIARLTLQCDLTPGLAEAASDERLQQHHDWLEARRHAELELCIQTLRRLFPAEERDTLPVMGW